MCIYIYIYTHIYIYIHTYIHALCISHAAAGTRRRDVQDCVPVDVDRAVDVDAEVEQPWREEPNLY